MNARPISTYSIIAISKKENLMGVAVQSHCFSVGSVVPWAESGVGVVATQSRTEPSYGPLGLFLMKAGIRAGKTLEALLTTDPKEDVRQVAMLDTIDGIAAHTGTQCIPESGHLIGDDFSVQANLMKSKEVWPAMASAFRRSGGTFMRRLMSALDAAEDVGGDIRGRQSAAMLVVKCRSTGIPWEDKVIDLRVEDHPEPLKELHRLITISEAYEINSIGDDLIAQGKVKKAIKEYRLANRKAPEILELKFWQVVSLLNSGNFETAREILKDVLAADRRWKKILLSLPRPAILSVDEETLYKIVNEPR
ncbi:MAG: DUF1028 domain-containing protein [Nitrososphaeria archaeon]